MSGPTRSAPAAATEGAGAAPAARPPRSRGTPRPLRLSSSRRVNPPRPTSASSPAGMALLPLLEDLLELRAQVRIDVPCAIAGAADHLALEILDVDGVLRGLGHLVGDLRRKEED